MTRRGSSGRLVLWDIDGTLVDAGGIGARAFDLAIERVLGARPPSRIRMSGMTDPKIVHGYLEMLGIEETEAEHHVGPVLGQLAAVLADAADEVRQLGRALPGVEAVLGELAGDLDVLQTVLTGNVAPNAVVKLEAFGLLRWLDLEVGAFGSDDADRNRLVPVALDRAAAIRGRRFAPEQVWVVGDSAADLACARASGVRCLLVATGRADYEELEALGADAVRHDLADTAAVVELLRG